MENAVRAVLVANAASVVLMEPVAAVAIVVRVVHAVGRIAALVEGVRSCRS